MLSRLRDFRAPELQSAGIPYLHASTSTHLQPGSRAPNLFSSKSLHLHRPFRPSSFLCVRTTPPVVALAPCGGRANPIKTFLRAARANPIKPHQNFTPARLHACSMPPELLSTPPKPPNSIPPSALLQRASRARELRLSTSRTPTARLQSSIPLCLYVCTTPELHTSTSARLQHDSRAPELPFLHAYTPAAHLPSSRAPYLYASTSARLQSSRAPYLHICTPAARL